MKIAEGFVWDEIIPVSAAIHDQVDLLNELIGKNLPAGPQYYPEGTTSDQAIEQLICEFIREAALQDVREELPHSIVVTIDEFGEREEKGSRPFFDVHATIHVERDLVGPSRGSSQRNRNSRTSRYRACTCCKDLPRAPHQGFKGVAEGSEVTCKTWVW
jgi:hypothetical protein